MIQCIRPRSAHLIGDFNSTVFHNVYTSTRCNSAFDNFDSIIRNDLLIGLIISIVGVIDFSISIVSAN